MSSPLTAPAFLSCAGRFVGAERHRALRTLRADREHRAVLKRLADDGQQRVPVAGDVARAERLDDDTAELFGHNGLEQRKLNARKYLDDADGNIIKRPKLEPAFLPRQEGGFIIFDGNARLGKARVVGRNESDESVGGVFCRAVAAQQLSAEVQARLTHDAFPRNQQRGDEVVAPVAANFAQRDLRAREHHGLSTHRA